MKRSLQAIALGCLVLLSACGKAPKHTRYIPADATFVVGINTEELGKKLSWSTLSGSPMMQELLRQMTDQKDKAAVTGLDKCGIEWMSTIYGFGRYDEGYSGKNQFVVVAPMKDAKAFDAYLKQTKPDIVIKTVKDRKEAASNGSYFAWNDHVLMMSSMARTSDYQNDPVATAADIDALFNLSKDASITNNKRFEALSKDKHDISALMSYEKVMNNNVKDLGMLAMAMAPVYKDAYFTMSFDFNKGRIEGLMNYYPGPDMQEIVAKMSGENVDDKMLKRLPGGNVNGVMGYHLSLAGTKMMLDKLNLTAMANAELQKQGLSLDDLLKATTGDIVVSASNLSVRPVTETYEGFDGPQTYTSSQPDIDVVMAVKIGDRNSLNKLLALLSQQGVPQSAPNTYTFPLGNQTATITIGNEYIVASNRVPLVQGYMAGSISPALSGDALKTVSGHPAGIYVDAQSMMTPFAGSQQGSDSVSFGEVRKLLKSFTMYGGEYKADASTYRMSLDMMNSDENSLVQIFNTVSRIFDASRKQNQQVVMQ